MNLLHDVSPGNKEVMNMIVEIPRGSKNKYEIDKETGLIALDRVNHTAQDYPFEYGFVPQTLWDDGDALDVILLTTYPLAPGILARVRPVGIMEMIDGGESDDKIIAVPSNDPRWAHIQDIKDLNPHTVKEIRHFHETYKKLQNKEVVVKGFKGKTKAETAFARAQKLYKESRK